MTPNEKRQLCRRIGDCLRQSPVAAFLPKCWERKLFEKHLEHPERSLHLCTTVEMEIGPTTGWFTLEQAGGGFQVHIWTPGGREGKETEAEAQDLSNCLSSILPASCIKIRYAKPHELLSRKGWPVHNGA